MRNLQTILREEVFPALKNPAPENLILGQSSHARRISQAYSCPSYIERISYPRHEKPEFCVCYKGGFVVKLGNNYYQLEPADACLVGRNVHHYESYVSPEQEYQILWFFLPAPEELVVNLAHYRNQVYDTLASLHCPVPASTIKHMDAALARGLSWDEVRQHWVQLVSVIEESIRTAIGQGLDIARITDRTSYDQKRIDQVWEYVHDHLAEEIKVEDVAKHLGLNTNYFQTFFHNAVGSTFVQYLTTLRLRRAQELLNDTSLNISEIAEKCGYRDPYYFSRVFRKHTGLSPRQFRQKY